MDERRRRHTRLFSIFASHRQYAAAAAAAAASASAVEEATISTFIAAHPQQPARHNQH